MLAKLGSMDKYSADKCFYGVLLEPPCELSQQLDVSLVDVELLYKHISNTLIMTPGSSLVPVSVKEYASCGHRGAIPTGFECLDTAIAGGVGRGSVTEITGASGSGKTVFALHLMKGAARLSSGEGTPYHTLWITSDGYSSFPVKAASNVLGSGLDGCVSNTSCFAGSSREAAGRALKMAQGLSVVVVSTITQLLECLPKLREHVSFSSGVRLVVVDDLNTMVRRSYSGVDEEVLERHNAVASLMQSFKIIAQEFSVAIVVLTQSVGDLGHAFLYGVNTRLRLSKCLLRHRRDAEPTEGELRLGHVLDVVKSSASLGSQFECEFAGIHLKRVAPLPHEALLLRDADFYGLDPYGHTVVPAFFFC
uniref:Uncharacterized protein TCIL3000_11_7650 n=1 Tax=Trypanosoma congolense (strain IL3000) TaxID=1068625 RepID=G0V105_TRYCI|nr:unnamed protein product [Trypanosoma congolense IL3000]